MANPETRACPIVFAAVLLATGSFLATGVVQAEDWPQWRGPTRDGNAEGLDVAAWPAQLEQAWRVEVGIGHASPLVVGDKVIVFSSTEETEKLSVLRLEDGATVWAQEDEVPFTQISVAAAHGRGPFATPLVADGRIYTFGITGVLSAWSLEDGDRLWRRAFEGAFKYTKPFYGAAQSPLLDQGRLIVHIGGAQGGALTAFDPVSGETLWQWKGEGPAYGSPVAVELDGTRQIVTMVQKGVAGFEAATGELLWREPYQVSFDTGSQTPVILGDTVFLSADKHPLAAYRIAQRGGWKLEKLWEQDEVSMQFSTPVLAPHGDGARLWGFSVKNKGQLFAADPESGELIWSGEPRQGENAYVTVFGRWLALALDGGELQIYDIAADEPKRVASYEVADSWMWAHPAYVGDSLLVKGKTELVRWRLPTQ